MNGLLVVPPICGTMKNIGDYIQSVAQEQFWGKVDCYVEREKMASFYSAEKVNLIMQGWFMWTATEFPPSDCINPFFISFHLSPSIANKLMSKKSIEYFKKHEPIGCRDMGTLRILEQYDIKCYFSGCLTLTLDLHYSSTDKSNNIYITDLYFELGGSKRYSKTKRLFIIFKQITKNPSKIANVKNSYSECKGKAKSIKEKLMRWCEAASLYYTYSMFFSDDILLKAKYLTHIIDVKGLSEKDKLEKAKEYIRIYNSAKLVITSRIHAALPCLAVKTPVIFCTADMLAQNGLEGDAGGRFEGLIDLMNYISVTETHSIHCSESLKPIFETGRISSFTQIPILKKHMSLSQTLIKRTAEFVSKCNSGGESERIEEIYHMAA